MKEKGLRLSRKHGVNPVIPLCFFCVKPKNEVILAGYIKGDAEAPSNAVWDRNPCDTCAEYMSLGIILVSVKDGKDHPQGNPYRTGGWVVVTEDAMRRILIIPQFADEIARVRFAFVPDQIWDRIGLPRHSGDLRSGPK